MSRLSSVLEDHCPSGVRYEVLRELLEGGTNIRWADAVDEEFQYIDLTSVDRITHSIGKTETITSQSAPSRAQQIVRAGDVLFGPTRPMLKRYCVVPAEYDGQIASTGYCVLRPKADRLLTNFLFHVLGTADFYGFVEANQRGASYPAIRDSVVKDYRIPVPPLEVQREIAKILDAFTELEAELEAELTVRERQYEYYRDSLFHLPGVRWTHLGEVADIGTGNMDRKDATDHGGYPFYVRSREVMRSETFQFDEEAVVIPGEGGVGEIFHHVSGKYALHQRAYRVRLRTPDISSKFAYYYFTVAFKRFILSKAVSATVTSIRKPMLEQFPIPVLPMERQELIVGVLDKFEALVNDLSIGLPAELNARRKQYEYYRDRLLTFPEAA